MSDFLGRLAARATGDGATVEPRLPSLFEPRQQAPIMPPIGDVEVTARRHEAPPRRPPEDTAEPVDPHGVRGKPADPAPMPAPARAAADSPRESTTPELIPAERIRTIVVERSKTAAAPEHRKAGEPVPVRPEPARALPSPRKTARMPSRDGVLLPVPVPVFAATSTVATGPGKATRDTRVTAGLGKVPAATGEPTVHVSIGRLEVRAAPMPATPARRRAGPKPGNLDDYLRQRSGKASP